MSKTASDQYTVTVAEARERFTDNSLSTVSPARIVVMCFERIDRDLESAEAAIRRGDNMEASALVGHAQEIISHLLDGIEASDWEHSEKLASVYTWTYGELLTAVVRSDGARVARVRAVLAPLGQAFTSAAAAIAPANETPSSGTGLQARA